MADLITPEMPVAPLEDLFNAIAAKVEGETSASVGSESARLARFPNPVQGNRVYRFDRGYEEAYFDLYNVTSNPGGRTVAGWGRVGPVGGQFAGSTNANGILYVVHNFGSKPAWVQVTPWSSGSESLALILDPIIWDTPADWSTTVGVRFRRNDTNGWATSQPVQGFLTVGR